MTHDEMISVLQAHREGKKIQCKNRYEAIAPWQDVPTPLWNFSKCKYRVKPETREWWLVGGTAYDEKEPAIVTAQTHGFALIHVREVIE